MPNNLESISNIEKFCKKYNLENLAKKENASFEDYKNLLDAMLADSRKHAKNIFIIKNVSSVASILTGAVSGWQIVKGFNDNSATKITISVVGGVAAVIGNIMITNKLIERELANVKDNALFAEDMYAVAPKDNKESVEV